MVKGKELQQELVAELKVLRLAVRDTAEGFILRKEGEIETLIDYLLKLPPGKVKEVAHHWLREAREMKLKPSKGRMKDLRRIDTLLHEFLGYLIEADEARETARGEKGKGGAHEKKSPPPERDDR